MPTLINAVICLQPHARGQTALVDAFRYLGTSSSPFKHLLVSGAGEHETDVEDQKHIAAELGKSFHGSRIELVSLPRTDDHTHWRYFAEQDLHNILHSRQPPRKAFDKHQRTMVADYWHLNEAFAAKVVEEYSPGDIICIHDYHLLLVPALVRQKLPEAIIGFFLNAPFPSSEFFRCAISKEKLLHGMLGSSIIFFQTPNYARLFRSACKRFLGCQPQVNGVKKGADLVLTESLPIGINIASMEEHAFQTAAAHRQFALIKRMYQGKKIIVSLDRLERSRCVNLKLLAFGRFLERYPHWRDKVVMIQIMSPSATEVEKDMQATELGNQLSSTVEKINGRFGSLTFSPLRYLHQHVASEEFLAVLRASDVGLFTSVRDSMSRNALAYIVCQRETHGSLIVSEFSGMAETLPHAIKVNPWHLEAVSDAIDAALNLNEADRAEAHQKLYDHAIKNTVQDWADSLVKRLSLVDMKYLRGKCHSYLDEQGVLDPFGLSNRRVFLLDYDGTLAPVVQKPEDAKPSQKLLSVLQELAKDDRNSVWIISGRDKNFLETHLQTVPGAGLVAEHGCFVRQPTATIWLDVTAEVEMNWHDEAAQVMEHFKSLTPGAHVEHKQVGLTWHYREAHGDYGTFMAEELHATLTDRLGKSGHEVRVMRGKMNVEVRPLSTNKGSIASKIMASEKPDFVLCAGDDTTDEDMFQAVHEARPESTGFVTCKVGGERDETEARCVLGSPDDVVALLEKMT